MSSKTEPGVYLYEHENYQGRVLHLKTSEPNLAKRNFNDITSSIRVVGEYRVTFFEHADYQGARGTIRTYSFSSTGSHAVHSDGIMMHHDAVSSLRRVTNGPAALPPLPECANRQKWHDS
jgi:Beta/Gamma crystallin